MNHLAHSEASKSAKTTESNFKMKIDELENNNAKLESELRRCVLSSHNIFFSDDCCLISPSDKYVYSLSYTVLAPDIAIY